MRIMTRITVKSAQHSERSSTPGEHANFAASNKILQRPPWRSWVKPQMCCVATHIATVHFTNLPSTYQYIPTQQKNPPSGKLGTFQNVERHARLGFNPLKFDSPGIAKRFASVWAMHPSIILATSGKSMVPSMACCEQPTLLVKRWWNVFFSLIELNYCKRQKKMIIFWIEGVQCSNFF